MRIILTAAIGLIAVTVTGCDINTTPKQAKVDCNCAQPPAPPAGMRGSDAYPPPPPPERGYRDHGHYYGHRTPHHGGYARWHGGGHSYYWRREYSEMSVFTYDYHSDSHSYTAGGHGGGYGGASAYAYAAAGAYAGGGASTGGGVYAGGGAHGGGGGYGGGHGGGYVGDAAHGGDDGYHTVPSGTVGDPAHHESGDDGRGSVWHGYDVDCPDPAAHR